MGSSPLRQPACVARLLLMSWRDSDKWAYRETKHKKYIIFFYNIIILYIIIFFITVISQPTLTLTLISSTLVLLSSYKTYIRQTMIHLLVNWDQRHVESCRETARVREKRRKSHYTLWLNVNRHLSFILIYVSFPNPFYKVGNINLYTVCVHCRITIYLHWN